MKKKILVLMMAFAMVLAFASCGGGGGSEAEPEAAAEPNAGIGGIVFSLPDGWTVSGSSLQGYMEVTVPDSDYILYANIFGEDDLESVNQWNPEHGADSLEADAHCVGKRHLGHILCQTRIFDPFSGFNGIEHMHYLRFSVCPAGYRDSIHRRQEKCKSRDA